MPAPDWDQPVQVDLTDIHGLNLYIDWGQKTVGFGQLSLTVKPEGAVVKLSGDTETMGKEWVRKALHAMIDSVCDALPEGKDIDKLHEGVEVPVPEPILEHRRKFMREVMGEEPNF